MLENQHQRSRWYAVVKCVILLPLSFLPVVYVVLAGIDYLVPPHQVHVHHDLLLAAGAMAFSAISGSVGGLVLARYLRRLPPRPVKGPGQRAA